MLNYVKSELYRVWRIRIVLTMAGTFSALVLLLNFALFLLKDQEHFRYGITSFSFSILVAQPMLYCYVAADVAASLYEGDRRKGAERNSIAGGISRMEIFAGKCLVSFLTALAILVLVLPVYIGSAVALLDPAGPTAVEDVLMELPAVALSGIASIILAVFLLEYIDKSLVAILTWVGIMIVLPKMFLLAGMLLGTGDDILTRIAMWMPQNFFMDMEVTMSRCAPIWDTAAGMGKCVIAGAAGILLFSLGAAVLLRKKEI